MIYTKGSPHVVECQAGQKIWVCRCGRTGNAPFCDGSHKQVEGVTPYPHAADKDGKVWLCGCGKSANIPFCDGTHKSL
jgi:CDGSH-type Zn-finger protein